MQAQAIQAAAPHARIQTIHCDITDTAAHESAFDAHLLAYSSLDVAVLNAGIGERGDNLDAANTGWQKTLDVDLTAVLHGVRYVHACVGA